ncbi:MAG: DUF262 domain-containing protein [Nitrospira sp.]|nr:DUF262 domain-containing protein [Nitrospira sp.]
MYAKKHLNLEPGFQRKSVWKQQDRAKLMDSIIRNYPLPAIFLYRNQRDGEVVYDVIDGKQRIESFLMFMGLKQGRFETKTQLPGEDEVKGVSWKQLCKWKKQYIITGYLLPVIEVDGEFGDIVEVFVRINSTGKALTGQEKRHAKYYKSAFLKEAAKVATKFQNYFLDMGVMGTSQISRMKHVELICELMLSIQKGDPINKKAALNNIMADSGVDMRQVGRGSRLTITALNRIRRMFPKLYTTRFVKITDFYTLTTLMAKFEQEGLILTDRRRNRLAWDILSVFSCKVDDLREKLKKAQNVGMEQDLYRQYLLTVTQTTDEVNQRRLRESIIRGLLESLFAKKDAKRGFSNAQRRIIWNTTADRRCKNPKCKKHLVWNDFTIDHIDPYSKGGRTRLENAALMCHSCNSAKGER